MRKINAWLIVPLMLLPCSFLEAQQQPLYSQYTLNKYLYNPAIAGADGYTSINLLARQQLVGFENAPATFVLTGQTRILDDSYINRILSIRKNEKKASRSGKVGVGGSIFSDRNGDISKTGIQLTYAYHINFNDLSQVSFGLSVSAFQFKLNDQNAVLAMQGDPLLNSTKKTFFIPDANVGVFFLTESYYAGFSLSNLMGSAIKLGPDRFKDYRSPRNVYLLAGYKWYPGNDLRIEPSVMMQTMQRNVSVDLNTTATYLGRYWLGLSYRTTRTVIVTAGASVKNFYFGYAYDLNMNAVRNYTSGSHELMIGMRFGDNDTRRVRWLHKDEKSFDAN